MTTIYLMHPKHGVKVATMEAEAQHDELHGWRRFELEDQLIAEPEPTNVMPEPRRRGRPRAEASE